MAGAESSWRPPWFDSAIASTPCSTAMRGVLDRLDALEDDRPVPPGAEPLDVLPGQARIELRVDVVGERDRRGAVTDLAAHGDVGEPDRIGADEVPGPAPGGRRPSRRVPGPDLRGQREAPTDVALATAEHRGVDGEDERLVGRGLGARDHLGDEAAVTPDVHLEPQRTRRSRRGRPRSSGCRGSRACRAGPPRCAARATASSPSGSAMRVKPVGASTRGSGIGRPRSRVDGSTAPTSRRTRGRNVRSANADAVGPHGALVLGRPVDVVEDAARQPPPGDGPQVVDRRGTRQPPGRRVGLDRLEPQDRPQGLEHAASARSRPSHKTFHASR